jgi:hypothetical protein
MSNMTKRHAADVDSTRDIFSPLGNGEEADEDDQTCIEDDVDSCGDDADGDGAASADEDNSNPWRSIASGANEGTRKRCLKVLDGYLTKDKMVLSTARDKTYRKLHHYLLDAFQNVYLSKLRFQRALAKDATNRKILQTAKRLRDRDNFGFDESVKYAVKKRRFLISSEMDKCFLRGNLAEEEEEQEEEEDDEEKGKTNDPSGEEEEDDEEEDED